MTGNNVTVAFSRFASTLAVASGEEIDTFANLVSQQRTRMAEAMVLPLNSGGAQARRTLASVIYGVLLERDDGSLNRLYIGESVSGLRIMWDLPIGESHHVASRIPPEAWARVIVVRWPLLLDRLADVDLAHQVDLEDVSAVRTLNRLIELYLNRELSPMLMPEGQRMGPFSAGLVR